MGDRAAKLGENFFNQAQKKTNAGCWASFSSNSKYADAAVLYEKSANYFLKAKAWDRAAAAYIKLAGCHPNLDSRHEAASAYVDAANAYKKIRISPKESISCLEQAPKEAISCLEQAVSQLMEVGSFNRAARCCKEIGELCEAQQNVEQAIYYFECAADLFQSEEVMKMNVSAHECKQKVAEFAAKQKQYRKAIEIYEEIAKQCLNDNLLKYSVKKYLLSAGLCQLCKDDVVALNNSLEKYQDLYPIFSGTRECKLLTDLAAAADEENVGKFTCAVKEFKSMTRLDAWNTTMLFRAEKALVSRGSLLL
ncbi:hypothetical protein MKW92_018222 [Papaver armeniacum]|nr:hypothetical protein MKW92_018222 [Papaver armeniacum]